jgi:hypothetical protein
LEREGHLHARSRIAFETDAVNDYFTRAIDSGSFGLWLVTENGNVAAKDLDFANNTSLQNGIANLSIRFPATCKIGDRLEFIAEVTDATQGEPFINSFSIVIHEEAPPKPVKDPGERQKPPGDKRGDEREAAGGIELPAYKKVPKDEWANQSPPFDQHTALIVKDSGVSASDAGANSAKVIYDFFINTDNVHLQRYLKSELKAGEDDRVARTRFELGMMLGGLALIHQDRLDKKANHGNGNDENAPRDSIETRVAEVTKAFAPFLLPMIDALGALDEEQIAASTTSGDAT